jgi:flagellar hook-basal body complex protein FliE
MATPSIAASAYARLARLAEPGGGLGKSAGEGTIGQGPNFAAVLKDAVASIAEAGKSSDTQVQAMATGKANIVDVVTAVAETETAIATLVSVRDKVIQAYEEIMRMPI